MVLHCLLDEINGPTVSQENAQDFLFKKNLLKCSTSCPGCNAAMSLFPCSSSKSYLVLLSMQEVQKHQNRQRSLWTEDRSEDLHLTPILLEHKGTDRNCNISDDRNFREHCLQLEDLPAHSTFCLAPSKPLSSQQSWSYC